MNTNSRVVSDLGSHGAYLTPSLYISIFQYHSNVYVYNYFGISPYQKQPPIMCSYIRTIASCCQAKRAPSFLTSMLSCRNFPWFRTNGMVGRVLLWWVYMDAHDAKRVYRWLNAIEAEPQCVRNCVMHLLHKAMDVIFRSEAFMKIYECDYHQSRFNLGIEILTLGGLPQCTDRWGCVNQRGYTYI